MYRLGLCFQHAGRTGPAEQCFRKYVDMILAGMNGTYPAEQAARRIRELHGNGRPGVKKEWREAMKATLQDAGVWSPQDGQRKPPQWLLRELLPT